MWLPSALPGGGRDGFAWFFPVLGLDGGADFAFTLGAPLRLHVPGTGPQQVSRNSVRSEDWDEPSDFGQLVQELRLDLGAGRFSLHAGPLSAETVGYGHLVSRYTNQLSPDYHPAGAILTASAGPVRVEALASDVLGARLFAGEVGLELGLAGRYHVSVAAAHDFGRIGGTSPALTLAQVGADASLYQGEHLRLFALASGGTRVDLDARQWGALLGLVVAGDTEGLAVSSRWELRRHGGSFRFGLFGPGYELARRAATGLSGVPLAEERLPQALSGFVELSVALDGTDDSLLLSASASAEHFAFGRTDADLALYLGLPSGTTSVTARLIATGLGTQPRTSATLEARQRLLSAVYAWASGGTVYLPQPDGPLTRGWSAGAGLGYGR